MKNFLFTLTLCVAGMLSLNAQISKPVEGDRLMEMRAAGLANLGSGLNQQYGGVMLRMFTSEMKAHRFAADFGVTFDNEKEEDKFTLDNIAINWGMENHMTGSKRMSTYWGYDAGVSASANFDEIRLQAGLFTGFDFYIADGLYLGSELGYRLRVTLDPFVLQLPGTAINASIKMGYRF
jgi:hypothetical protein